MVVEDPEVFRLFIHLYVYLFYFGNSDPFINIKFKNVLFCGGIFFYIQYSRFYIEFIKQYCFHVNNNGLVKSQLVLLLDLSVLSPACVRLILDKSAKDAVAEPLFAGFACKGRKSFI